MGNKSFYDLDYIIEINEQRLEQYANAYQKSVERFTTLLAIYSALCIFLVPIIQTLFLTKAEWHWSYYCSFWAFCILFIISIVNSILLLSPGELGILLMPNLYYKHVKQFYQENGFSSDDTDAFIKGHYIVELEKTITENSFKLHRKISFYNRSFYYVIIACIPYLYCIWPQISNEKKSILKKDNIHNLSSFTKTNHICGRENQNTKK
jgi:hypothetical protein